MDTVRRIWCEKPRIPHSSFGATRRTANRTSAAYGDSALVVPKVTSTSFGRRIRCSCVD